MFTPCSGPCGKAFHMYKMVEIRNGLWMCFECRSHMARKYILQNRLTSNYSPNINRQQSYTMYPMINYNWSAARMGW